jgi:hypothetical protein
VHLLATLGALLGVVDGSVRRCLLATTWGHLPASLGRMKFGRLIADGILGGDILQLLSGVPQNVTLFTLAQVPCEVFGSRHLASLSASLGFDASALLPHWAQDEKSSGGDGAILCQLIPA